ncbi:hypothetical protein [Streptomyces mayonensis]|uniref:hypothetical protein n=1 Tax=Streptomyces mayonensis TaxID=2750816 RepID=UPI001C1E0442|nr:hypothetical protein [Streptomyces sp. A108]MBU6534012.1 hypothetical protein [Streptomyces sp. A108]
MIRWIRAGAPFGRCVVLKHITGSIVLSAGDSFGSNGGRCSGCTADGGNAAR